MFLISLTVLSEPYNGIMFAASPSILPIKTIRHTMTDATLTSFFGTDAFLTSRQTRKGTSQGRKGRVELNVTHRGQGSGPNRSGFWERCSLWQREGPSPLKPIANISGRLGRGEWWLKIRRLLGDRISFRPVVQDAVCWRKLLLGGAAWGPEKQTR